MAGTEKARQAILLQDLLYDVIGIPFLKTVIQIDNRTEICITKKLVFHGQSKHIHTRYNFIKECVEKRLLEVEHIPDNEQKADILTKSLGRTKFKEMRDLIGIKDVCNDELKLKGENVG